MSTIDVPPYSATLFHRGRRRDRRIASRRSMHRARPRRRASLAGAEGRLGWLAFAPCCWPARCTAGGERWVRRRRPASIGSDRPRWWCQRSVPMHAYVRCAVEYMYALHSCSWGAVSWLQPPRSRSPVATRFGRLRSPQRSKADSLGSFRKGMASHTSDHGGSAATVAAWTMRAQELSSRSARSIDSPSRKLRSHILLMEKSA